jgi:CHAT domain-containing protein
VRLAEVRQALGGACLVTYLRAGDQLCALAVTATRHLLVAVGAVATARERLLRVRADLDVIAGREASDPLHGTLLRALRADAAALSAQLLGPVMPLLGDRALVVVPTADLITVPWGALPAANGRTVTVTPSATLWADRQSSHPRTPSTLLLAAGPRLPQAEAELAAIAELGHRAGMVTTLQAAPTTSQALQAMNDHDVVQLACHGHHVTDNPLFSGLEFADGLLMGYDLLTLARPPRTVVLSACDLGMADARPGDESLGVASALLAAGTGTVVASVARTGDSATAGVMARLYSRLLDGTPVASALAEAISGEPSGFICLGAG